MPKEERFTLAHSVWDFIICLAQSLSSLQRGRKSWGQDSVVEEAAYFMVVRSSKREWGEKGVGREGEERKEEGKVGWVFRGRSGMEGGGEMREGKVPMFPAVFPGLPMTSSPFTRPHPLRVLPLPSSAAEW